MKSAKKCVRKREKCFRVARNFHLLKRQFFSVAFLVYYTYTVAHVFPTHTHTHSYESSGLFLGFVFHFVFFFYSLLVFVFSTFGDVSTYKLVRVFRARGGKLHAWNISSTCQQIIIVICLFGGNGRPI